MQFDRLAETVEKHFPEHVPVLQNARLFLVQPRTGPAPSSQEAALEDWEPDEVLKENFRLPFESVAVENGRGCVVIKTANANERRFFAIGLERPASGGKDDAIVFECQLTALPDGIDKESARTMWRLCAVDGLRVWEICRGKKTELDFLESELSVKSKVRVAACSTENAMELAVKSSDRAAMRRLLGELERERAEHEIVLGVLSANIALLICNRAVLELIDICQPSTFIVEESQVGMRPRVPAAGKVIRSPYRPHFIVLTPGEIKRRYLYDEHDPSGIPKAPHERRGHFRKLTSERYVSKRNHVIWVKACWVGKTEGVRGKNKYVVRVDL